MIEFAMFSKALFYILDAFLRHLAFVLDIGVLAS